MVNFHVCTLKYKDQYDIWSPAHQLLTGNLPFGNRSQNLESFKKQVQMTILCIDIHRHNKDSYLPIHYLSKLLRFYLSDKDIIALSFVSINLHFTSDSQRYLWQS